MAMSTTITKTLKMIGKVSKRPCTLLIQLLIAQTWSERKAKECQEPVSGCWKKRPIKAGWRPPRAHYGLPAILVRVKLWSLFTLLKILRDVSKVHPTYYCSFSVDIDIVTPVLICCVALYGSFFPLYLNDLSSRRSSRSMQKKLFNLPMKMILYPLLIDCGISYTAWSQIHKLPRSPVY